MRRAQANPRRARKARHAAKVRKAEMDATRKSRTGKRPVSARRRKSAVETIVGDAHRRTGKPRTNPTLAIFGNPGGRWLLGTRVYEVAYRHAEDGRDYKHRFERQDVRLYVLANGDALLHCPRARLWEDC